MPHADSTFDIDSWDEQTWSDHEDVKLGRAHVTKTWHGDLEGTSTTEILTALTPVETTRAYFGVERFVGAVDGHQGTFVLQHSALARPTGGATDWIVMPDAATGDLTGITGAAQIDITPDGVHHLALDYELPAG